MILCHKCSGLLAWNKEEDTTGLLSCQCISGWVRGNEPVLNRQQVITCQFYRCFEWIELYTRQGREQYWIDNQLERAEKLINLI